jgi:hypothetical protein
MRRNRYKNQLGQTPIEIIRGAEIIAQYLPQEVSQFRDNPLNEALPHTLTPGEITEYLLQLPTYSDKDCELSQVARLQMTETAREFFVPNGKHLTVYYAITNMIRRGYIRRNPILWEYWKQVHQSIESFLKSIKEKPFPNSRARGLAIVGSGGTGKSTTVEKILQSLPQVITHGSYKGRDFIMKQLVWLKLDCPRKGSLGELCINFFRAADEILGTQYEKHYAKGHRRTHEALIAGMARVVANHCLGIIVIDEIQDLSEARSGGEIMMINFFVHLENAIGVPFALIGTQEAIPLLSGQFRQARRVSEQGYIAWDRMSEMEPEIEGDEDDDDEESEVKPSISAKPSTTQSKEDDKKKAPQPDRVWKNFVETLWIYQYVKQRRPLKENVVEDKCAHALYRVSKGIPAVVQTVFVLTQQLAILTEEEKITPRLIHDTVRMNLKVINELIGEARMKSPQEIKPVGDLADLEQIYEVENPLEEFSDMVSEEVSTTTTQFNASRGFDGEAQPKNDETAIKFTKGADQSNSISKIQKLKLKPQPKRPISSNKVTWPQASTAKRKTNNHNCQKKDKYRRSPDEYLKRK